MSQPIRIGELLVERGVLSEQQVFEVVQAQRKQRLPFGVLAESMFDVTLSSIEAAWADQYHRFTGTIDLSQERFDPAALPTINRRQAWQFEILPIRTEATGELVVAASRQRLARAVTFAAERITSVVYFRVAEPDQLRQFLRRYYPMPEISEALRQQARDYAATPA